jgi:SAM-dependent methyltransferase
MNELETSYDPRYFEILFKAEEKHFWFSARNKVIRALVHKTLTGNGENCRILEVGCGTGNVLQQLEKGFDKSEIYGMDLFLEGLRFARIRVNCPLIQADIAYPPFFALFDLVGVFDVLEHIKEDRKMLGQLFDLIKPGGKLLLTVPANPRLWSYFDVASHHERRYDLLDLIEKVVSAGYEIEFASPYIAATYPLIWLNRKVKGENSGTENDVVHKQAEDELRIVPIANAILSGILGLEANWLSTGRKLPFGSSLVLIARKPGIISQ